MRLSMNYQKAMYFIGIRWILCFRITANKSVSAKSTAPWRLPVHKHLIVFILVIGLRDQISLEFLLNLIKKIRPLGK